MNCWQLIFSLTLVCIQDEITSSLKTLVPKFLTAKEFLLLDLSKMEELAFVLFITMVLVFCVEFQDTWLISSWEELNCCYKLSNWQNDNYFHWFFKLVKWDNSQNSTQKMRTCVFWVVGHTFIAHQPLARWRVAEKWKVSITCFICF